jgi:DNA-binding transcriptional ArsR family regulator
MVVEGGFSVPANPRPTLVHPDPDDITLVGVLHALADPTRLTIVRTLSADPERACGTFPVAVAPSTLSHHFKVLREAGLTERLTIGGQTHQRLRTDDLEESFPGVVSSIVAASRG